MRAALNSLRQNLRHVIRGKESIIELLLAALLADGHVLIEDLPGTGKTTLAKALARSLAVKFARIQFTPDLLPTDILGGVVYSASNGSFTFRPGPVHANIILADEINRASPRTQSALLEAMGERQVTTEGETRALPRPFWVLATQNPIEHSGTYPLPEAQLDRFCMRIALGYPSHADEMMLLRDQEQVHPLDTLQPVLMAESLLKIQAEVRAVELEDSVLDYLTRLVGRTRADARLRLGAGPRGTLDLRRTAQAWAYLQGRHMVRPEDVQRLAAPVLTHRLLLDLKTRHSGVSATQVVEEIIAQESVPA